MGTDGSFVACDDHVIFAGSGRVGQTLGRALDAEGLSYVTRDADAGSESASAVVVTMIDPAAASRIVREVHRRWPDMPIHARHLVELGATYCTPEAVEASLQLSAKALLDLGVRSDVIQRRIAEQRALELG